MATERWVRLDDEGRLLLHTENDGIVFLRRGAEAVAATVGTVHRPVGKQPIGAGLRAFCGNFELRGFELGRRRHVLGVFMRA
jgi:hypothetical protein